MTAIYRAGLLCLLLLLSAPGYAASIFYQPLTRDQAVTDAQWLEIWQGLRAQGYEQVIVQWTRVDNEDFGAEGGWLNRALRYAEDSGISLVLGLHYESNYYPVLGEQNSSVYFWHHLLGLSRLQQQQLMTWQLKPVGWFIPYDLDDTLYRSDDMLQEISYQLASFVALGNGPVHLRASSSGQLSPDVYADWLSGINEEGVQVWWESGAAIEEFAAARDSYQSALPCDVGVVGNLSDHASSLTNCHPEVVWSLRDLPTAAEYFK